jgi:hypothetical protein
MLFTAIFTLALLAPAGDTTVAKPCSSGCHIYFGKYQECAPGMKVVVKGRDFYCDPKDSMTSKIENALLRDGLISDRGNYTFTFTNKSLTVNGQQQPAETWERYRKLIEDTSGHKIGSGYSYVITKNSTD